MGTEKVSDQTGLADQMIKKMHQFRCFVKKIKISFEKAAFSLVNCSTRGLCHYSLRLNWDKCRHQDTK